ncbi:MAG TPA: PEGA domain-containing protein [Candidatus Saccharimonadales bacterium]|nr:PEGA domain-containing protein [Candidatus Saccharimonadales bacterium]
MDFLDPKKKKSRQIRLAIGHSLMVLLVFAATYILVFRAYGYNFDRKTGEVIQDGLVYIDSTPRGATITINGRQQGSKTNSRFSLPEGEYTLEISKPGYQTWKRNFMLEGGHVLRYDYPFLFPDKLTKNELQTFDSKITFSTESPDRRWILLHSGAALNTMTLFDLNNTTNSKPLKTDLTFPAGLFKEVKGSQNIKLVEWSTDNRHLLIRHNYGKKHEFIMLDMQQPSLSYNLTQVIGQNPDSVRLFDKRFDKLYVYNATSRVLSIADIKNRTLTAAATGIISYKPYGSDTILFSKLDPDKKTRAEIIMRQKNRDYVIRRIPVSVEIPLDITKYSGDWYVVAGSPKEHRSYVYKNPIDLVLNNPEDLESVRAYVLKNTGPVDMVAFSQNARFIMSNSKQNFSVYDAELEKRYSYTIDNKFDSPANPMWMDGDRIVDNTGGKAIEFDYDGINKNILVKSDVSQQVMFDRNYEEMYSLGPSASTKGKYGLYVTELRIKADR